MPEITFQKATIEDIDAFIAIEQKSAHSYMYSNCADREDAEDELKNCEVYFIKKDGVIVGSTEYQIKEPGHAYMSGLVIDPAFQGQGIARKAIEFKLEQLKDMKRIDLVTHPHNSKVICMYLSYGFIIEAWKDNYYGDGQPRLVLALNR
ncbi:MAG: acetyltransferase [uncultured bacterium]|uniref:Acetyltransferase n=1 Tax=Candidatus Wolfebacteria bacterium GW2011_GWE2_44_13 TaxID=1619017 RepID=A0A0G1JI35_9BACT|nr:MAG: acetyltransferase [uncultured bacterium]KKT43632.1 MAG: Acetyltransferase [Candidatus Wolfebacteria bacterium GW2011_GWE2_44_13]